MRRLSSVAVLFCLISIACGGDSSGPKSPTALSIAVQMDSLYAKAVAAHQTIRASYISFAHIGPSLGASPTSVPVVTATGTATWQAYAYQIIDTAGAASDTTTFVVLYADDSLSAVVVASIPSTTSPVAHILYADTLVLAATATTATAADGTVGAPCTLAPGLTDPAPAMLNAASVCSLATYTVSLTVIFPPSPGLAVALRSVAIASQTLNGERFIQPAH